MSDAEKYHYSDFTEARYRDYLRVAKNRRQFGFYPDSEQTGDGNSIWRHDVDVSLERALRLAIIESEEGLTATYFLHFHNPFYNLLDANSLSIVHRIRELGHEIGLHFEVYFYQQQGELKKQSDLENFISKEKEWFYEWLGFSCRVVSFHNPDTGVILDYSQFSLAGLINASSEYFRKDYEYVSDSNGYWRFSRLEDVLKSSKAMRLHILTHPEWWTENILSTEERFDSAVRDRTEKQIEEYKAHLKVYKRLMP